MPHYDGAGDGAPTIMKINRKQKELIVIYIFLFALIFVVINWDTVSWMFNYKEVAGLVADFFTPYQDSNLLVSADTGSAYNPPTGPALSPIETKTQSGSARQFPYSDKDNSLEIPSLGLVTSMVAGQTTDVNALEQDLDKGVVLYPGSVYPGQDGQMVVLGHSAPPGWPHIKHDWVFSNIENLTEGDQIIVYYNHRQYTYRVVSKKIIQQGEDVAEDGKATGNVLTIVSCWPPGKNYKRIAIEAELVR